jgi:GT2 family glycosyltransferase
MEISVVIPNYNGQKLLEKNLPHVINAAPKAEIVVVDDASTDNSVEFLKTNFPKVIIIKNQKNLRFSKSCNKGVKAAKGDIVVLLNSDVKPEKDFLQPLLNHFQTTRHSGLDPESSSKLDEVFSVGCREIKIQNDKKVFSGRTEGKWEMGLFTHWKPEDQESQNTFWNFGGSMAVDRVKFLSLGGFDPIYSPAYWEDIDLSYRAKKKGWQVLFEKDSVVHHQHESTNKNVFGKNKINQIALRNQIIFSLKHKPYQFILWSSINLIYQSINTNGRFVPAFLKAMSRFLFKYEK